jgi:murein L,D-transpeptidase YcbB/YkuD
MRSGGLASRERSARTIMALLSTMTAFWSIVPAVPLAAQDGEAARSVADALQSAVERLRATGSLQIGDEVIPRLELTMAVYEERGFLPLWTNPDAGRSLLRGIVEVREDGLDPRDYHLLALSDAAGAAAGPTMAAGLDLLRTDAFIRMALHLRFGKVRPRGPSSERETPWLLGGPDAVDELAAVVASGRVRETLDALRPEHFAYRGLREALADLYRVQAAGGWGTIPSGATMEEGSRDERVRALRRRLAMTDDLGVDADGYQDGQGTNLRVDAALVEAIRSFQHRHGLNEDGRVGPTTLKALNVPVERRIEQVRVNLERARWIVRELPDTFVAVNVAGANVHFVRGGHQVFESRGIVGRAGRETPTFTAPMLYVELNPTWTVPPGVVGEVLGLVADDPEYLERQGMRVLDHSGQTLDPSTIDFSRYSADDFPYVFQQDPGPANALGRIKLMFPNPYSIYLHDTPTRGLFAAEERLFSHGCIRVEDPLGLAELVLGDPLVWNRETLQAAIRTGKTRTIRLSQPVPVYVLYWTASVDREGDLHLYRDVYDRDPAILAELDATIDSGTLTARLR